MIVVVGTSESRGGEESGGQDGEEHVGVMYDDYYRPSRRGLYSL